MSVDIADLVFHLDRRWGVNQSLPEIIAAAQTHQPPDLGLLELANLICQAPRRCRACGYDLRAQGKAGVCPECGGHFSPIDLEECCSEIAAALHDVLDIPVREITPQSMLIADLGC